LQGELLRAQTVGDTSLYYVDDELHPDAAIRAAIINGTFNDNSFVRQSNFIEKNFQMAVTEYEKNWGDLPQNQISFGKTLNIGNSGSRVRALNRRLMGITKNSFDENLGTKIKEYRKAHGLPVGRYADKKLIESLNLGFAHYKRKISVNMHRASELPGDLGDKFILVNAANQQLQIYEGNKVVNQMRVIVGTSRNPTPMIAAFLRFSVVNPYWNIPSDITRDRFAPRALKEGEAYLKSRRFEALSSWKEGAKILSYSQVNWQAIVDGEMTLRLRQRPGPGNGMGDIKFMFPNRFGVYLHDTHNEAPFQLDTRAISAGCVRVERPWELAQWLYGERPKVNSAKPEQIINLENKIPIYINYFTAIPNGNDISFHDDIYGRDARLMALQDKKIL